ncbi:hypothetical protein [Thermomonospora catenispora]|uniref:hypothetical protein n=1 Tax=Thermomonospora catenispora TaxID=2493090 RepID=UPI001F4F45E0|nr:hypothetical protein [Thermomonospora catenispora]
MRHLTAALVGLGLGLAALGPALSPGFTLAYDMVFVPEPEFDRMTFGLTGTLPRHVPSDALVALLGTLLPGDLVQKLILLSVFVMACTSAAWLVPSEHAAARLAAGVCYAWNPFVAERLLLGQWALLLGYAALPWALGRAAGVTARGGGRRLLLSLVPAGIGGFAALAVSGLAALVVAVTAARPRATAALRVAGAVLVLSLPWLVTGWLRPAGVPADTAAVEAFAARADTPFGAVGSLLLLGGVWNGETVPRQYGHPVTATAWLLVVLAALAAYGHRWRCERDPAYAGVAAAGLAGFAVAALGAVAPWLLRGLIALWPGFAVLRDGQQYVAPLAVVVAVGAGLAVAWLLPRVPAFGVVCAALLPIALLPSLAWGAAGRLQSVRYPDSWEQARRIVRADRVPGDVLVLPWAPYRSYPWNGHRRVLNPLPRYLPRRVVLNDAVTVGDITVPTEDPRAKGLDAAVRGHGPLTATLRAHGIRYVAVDAEAPSVTAALRARMPEARVVLSAPELTLLQVPSPRRPVDPAPPQVIVVIAWIVTIGVVGWSMSGTPINLVAHSTPFSRRKAPLCGS